MSEVETARSSGGDGWPFLFAAWLVALAAAGGALFVGEVMGQTPCVLCWHQRAFMFPLVIVLAVASFRGDLSGIVYAFPLAVVGGGVAAFHALLYAGIIPEAIEPCGTGPSCVAADMTVLGLPLPYLSLAAFALIVVLLLAGRKVKP